MARRRADQVPLRDAALRSAKRRFKEIFPRGFSDPTYLTWERNYKWAAHKAWVAMLGRRSFERLLAEQAFGDLLRISRFYAHSKLNMLALYEWMAFREALATSDQTLAVGAYQLIYGRGDFGARLEQFTGVLDALPQRQTRLAKWPVATLLPFIARPRDHLIVKPNMMKRAFERFHFDLHYRSRPNADTYRAVMELAHWLGRELTAWKPRDLIDIQGFIWVTCSEEYEHWPWE